jgi:hypothetical protein
VKDQYYQDVQKLIEETDKLYVKIAAKHPGVDKVTLMRDRCVEHRGWKPALPYIQDNFSRVLKQSGSFFVPKIMSPGSAFVFPIRDVDGRYRCAQTKPLEGSVLFDPSGKKKYCFIGEEPIGPRWLGADPETIKLIMKLKAVMCMEGPFDWLASKLLCPELPILTPLTKRLGKKHIAFLRMLGVKNLFLMYDNEFDKKTGGEAGAGQVSMREQVKFITSMKAVGLDCPAGDPSSALKESGTAKELKSIIELKFRTL